MMTTDVAPRGTPLLTSDTRPESVNGGTGAGGGEGTGAGSGSGAGDGVGVVGTLEPQAATIAQRIATATQCMSDKSRRRAVENDPWPRTIAPFIPSTRITLPI